MWLSDATCFGHTQPKDETVPNAPGSLSSKLLETAQFPGWLSPLGRWTEDGNWN